MSKYKIPVLIAVLALTGVGFSQAAQVDLGEAIVKSDYVEVNRLAETKDVIVIDKEQLQEKDYNSLVDVLEDISSINVGLTGYGRIDIRGQGAGKAQSNIKILIDGAPITVLTSHPFETNYDYIPVQNIEKIEIIPGGGSVMYGAGASGGVINITTNLHDMEKAKNTITLGKSSKESNYAISLSGKIEDNITYQIDKSKVNKDLYFKNTYIDTDYFAIGAALKLNDKQRISVRHSDIKDQGQDTGSIEEADFKKYGKDYTTTDYDNIGKTLKVTSVDYVNKLSDNSQLTIDAYHLKGKFSNLPFNFKQLEHKTKGINAKYDLTYGSNNNNKLLLGYEYTDQDAKSGMGPLHYYYNKAINAYYVNNTFNKGKLAFTQGLRYEHVDWRYDKQSFKGKHGIGNRRSNDIGASFGIAYHYDETGRVYFNTERGFNHPDGIQVVDQDLGNPKILVPSAVTDEKYNNFELGWNDKIGKSNVSVVGFYSETDNEFGRISFKKAVNGHANNLTFTRNMFDVKRHGVDINIVQELGKLRLKEGYAYLKGHRKYSKEGLEALAEFKKTGEAFAVDALQDVPKHKFVLAAEYKPNDDWELTATYNYVGKYNLYGKEGGLIAKEQSKSRQIVDLDVAYKGVKDTTFHVGVKNLFDEQYYSYEGESYKDEDGIVQKAVYPGDEREFYASVTYKF